MVPESSELSRVSFWLWIPVRRVNGKTVVLYHFRRKAEMRGVTAGTMALSETATAEGTAAIELAAKMSSRDMVSSLERRSEDNGTRGGHSASGA